MTWHNLHKEKNYLILFIYNISKEDRVQENQAQVDNIQARLSRPYGSAYQHFCFTAPLAGHSNIWRRHLLHFTCKKLSMCKQSSGNIAT